MIPSGDLYHNSTGREKHDLKLTALTPPDSRAATSEVKTKTDTGCCTTDRMENRQTLLPSVETTLHVRKTHPRWLTAECEHHPPPTASGKPYRVCSPTPPIHLPEARHIWALHRLLSPHPGFPSSSHWMLRTWSRLITLLEVFWDVAHPCNREGINLVRKRDFLASTLKTPGFLTAFFLLAYGTGPLLPGKGVS